MALTNAQKQERWRKRQKARIAELEALLAKWPTLYDISLDEERSVTQADVDGMMRKLNDLLGPKIYGEPIEYPEVFNIRGERLPAAPGWGMIPRFVGEIEDGKRKARVGIIF